MWTSVRGLLGLAIAAMTLWIAAFLLREFGRTPWDGVGEVVWIAAMIVFWVTMGRLAWVNSVRGRRPTRGE